MRAESMPLDENFADLDFLRWEGGAHSSIPFSLSGLTTTQHFCVIRVTRHVILPCSFDPALRSVLTPCSCLDLRVIPGAKSRVITDAYNAPIEVVTKEALPIWNLDLLSGMPRRNVAHAICSISSEDVANAHIG
jgi:hypothetical protein